MGDVLSFSPRRAAVNRSPRTTADAPASVIIFPGVRYERPSGDKGANAMPKDVPPMAAPSPRR